jgi:chlorobactene glucosyltransferase
MFLTMVALSNIMMAPRLKNGLKVLSTTSSDLTQDLPTVSILIPARNEAHQIEKCVTSLLKSHYPKFEIIVADDQSTDATPAILHDLANRYGPRLKTFSLSEPPSVGWTGKARTCHELAHRASGEMLIFCDADVEVTPDAVGATVGWLWHKGMDAVTALPSQVGGTPLVRAVVSVITQFLILVTLPLWLVPRTRSPSLATGNGQWFAWRRSLYDRIGGHAAVKSSRIEDVALARRAKAFGGKLVSVLSPNFIRVHMYADWPAARQGFLKNLFSLVGESLGGVCSVGLFVLICGASPILAWFFGDATLGVLAITFMGLLATAQYLAFRCDLFSVVMLPLGVVLSLALLCESAYRTRRGNILWKDRPLPSPS